MVPVPTFVTTSCFHLDVFSQLKDPITFEALVTSISLKLSSLYSGLDSLVVLSLHYHFCLSFLAISRISDFSLCSSSSCCLFTSHSAFFCSVITQCLSFSASLFPLFLTLDPFTLFFFCCFYLVFTIFPEYF